MSHNAKLALGKILTLSGIVLVSFELSFTLKVGGVRLSAFLVAGATLIVLGGVATLLDRSFSLFLRWLSLACLVWGLLGAYSWYVNWILDDIRYRRNVEPVALTSLLAWSVTFWAAQKLFPMEQKTDGKQTDCSQKDEEKTKDQEDRSLL